MSDITGTPTITGWVDVSNRALAKVGTDLIDSMEDGSENQRYCSLLILEATAEILDAYDYQAALQTVELALDVDTPLIGYDYQYDLPEDFLRLKEVITDTGGPWAIEGNLLLTDAEEVYLKYFYMPTTPVGLPPHIIQAIVTTLALKLCTPLAADNELYAKIERAYNKAIDDAKTKETHNTVQETYEDQMGFVWFDEVR